MLMRVPSVKAEGPISEPLIVPDIILDKVDVGAGRHIVKFVGIVTISGFRREPAERRIVARFSVPIEVACDMLDDLSQQLGERRPEVAAAQFRNKRADN